MLESEILLNDIRKGLAYFQWYIASGQKVNLTDANVRAEDFVANLLNSLFGWELKNVNDSVANYPCIDLIDYSLRCGVQVTAERGSEKIGSTIQCLVKCQMGEQIQSLKVFSLVPKQHKYTIKVSCDGVLFDWKKDVLDFNDVVREATKITNLDHLQFVRQQVVDSFPSIFPEVEPRIPTLRLPVTDSEISWLAFSSRATKLVGRDDEMRELLDFLNSSDNFSWWLILGVAGSGKSRLALDLCEQAKSDGWSVGFLSRTDQTFRWPRFNPVGKTLIILDYVASWVGYVSDAILELSRISPSFGFPVRVLLLERNILSWWPDFLRKESPSESAEVLACQRGDPMELRGLDQRALLKIAKEVVLCKGAEWENEKAKSFLAEIERYECGNRPLYAMILAEFPQANDIDDLLRQVLAKECARRKVLVPSDCERIQMENLLFLASIVGGVIPRLDGSLLNEPSEITDLLPSTNLLNENAYCDFAGSSQVGNSLSGLQPDLLGERFVLDALCEVGLRGQKYKRLFKVACREQPDNVAEFAFRAFLDFGNVPATQQLLNVPSDSYEYRIFRAKLVSQLFAMPSLMFNDFMNEQLDDLIKVADCFTEEERLQELTALAEYNLACVLFLGPKLPGFLPSFKEVACSRFDAVIARVGENSRVGVLALLNRGVLFDDDKMAVPLWTKVIESDAANDETRACALNNRANCLMDSEDHEGAVRDRTSVIELDDTSADRRFVALFGRAKSHIALKKFQNAVRDLTILLESEDISEVDKLHARLQRGVSSYFEGQIENARNDFKMVGILLKQGSVVSSPRIFREEVRSEMVPLVEGALDRIGGKNPASFTSFFEQIAQWNYSNANRLRVSRPEPF